MGTTEPAQESTELATLAEPLPAGKRPGRRRRSHSRRGSSNLHGRLRKIYFGLAAMWGFLVGTGAVLGGLAAVGRPMHVEPVVGTVLLGAAVLALVGGVLAALAYREASRRFR